jgi:hypothetical protein
MINIVMVIMRRLAHKQQEDWRGIRHPVRVVWLVLPEYILCVACGL